MKKVILITGASSGMGKDAALRLIKEGHRVYGAARRVHQMQSLIEAGGYAIELDVTDPASIQSAADRVLKEQGRIDVLWNNAGYSLSGAVENVSYEEAVRQFEVNLFGVAEMTKAVLPKMRQQEFGKIVNTSSIGGRTYMPVYAAWYHASKYAVEGWSNALRMEVAEFGIDVVILEPGGVATEFIDVLNGPMVERSKGTAYEKQSLEIAQGMQALNGTKNLAPTSVISEAMVKIVNAKKPKTRYVVGKGAGMLIILRKLLNDRSFDLMSRRMTKMMLKG